MSLHSPFSQVSRRAWMAANVKLQNPDTVEAAAALLNSHPSVEEAMKTMASEAGRSGHSL